LGVTSCMWESDSAVVADTHGVSVRFCSGASGLATCPGLTPRVDTAAPGWRGRLVGGSIAAGTRTRCSSEELLHEARRLYGLGLSLRAVAETLLGQTSYANAHSAEVALRFQFKRRGWPLRNRAQAQRARRAPKGEDLARAA
jgi:hypothetical protein